MDDAQKPKANYSVFLVDDDRFLLDMYSMKFKTAAARRRRYRTR